MDHAHVPVAVRVAAHMRIENSRILRADRLRDLLLHLEDLRSRLDERRLEAADFSRDLRRLDRVTRDLFEVVAHDIDLPPRDARRDGEAVETCFRAGRISNHAGGSLTCLSNERQQRFARAKDEATRMNQTPVPLVCWDILAHREMTHDVYGGFPDGFFERADPSERYG